MNACAVSSMDPICGFVAATNVEELSSQWSCNTTGMPETDPCGSPNWHGINCDSDNLVTSISFSERNLTGTLSSSLGGLLSLQGILLNRNRLHGSIPPEFQALSLLQHLDLGTNGIDGTIFPQVWWTICLDFRT